MDSFYNTTNERGQILIDFNSCAKTQEQMVYDFFKTNFGKAFTWADVHKYLPQINEVSLKRSITNLKNKLMLRKTEEKGVSKYGKPAYKYTMA